MYAIIKTGGKQYRVQEGQIMQVEKLTSEPGQEVAFKEVLMISDGVNVQVGNPYLEGVQVKASLLDQVRARKIEIIKFKRRKHHMKRMGHRQNYSKVKITSITKNSTEDKN